MKKTPPFDLGNACAALNDAQIHEFKAIATQYHEATGVVMRVANWVGSKAEDLAKRLPDGIQGQIGWATEQALKSSYWLAEKSQPSESLETWKDKAFHWAQGHRWHQVCASVSGAATGFGGFATTLVDLPVVTTLILRSIQQTALDMGEDISDPEVRAACLSVFGIGGPLIEDDGVDTGLFGARLALTGKSIAEILLLVLPRFGMSVSQKVVLQAAPVLGAVAGAAVNQAFMRYYQEIAKVHFRLRRLEAEADKEQVQACFERIYGQMYPKSLQKPSKRSLLRTLPHLIR